MYNSYNVRKDLNQGVVPIGVPKAYNFDYGVIETARAEVKKGLVDINTSVNNGIGLVNNATNAGLDNINSAKNNATESINNLGDIIINQIEHGYGYPFVVNTAAEMTDITKIYVYVGNEEGYTYGNWYYYNGIAWVSGGVYNSTAFETDKALTISGAAADAKVVGDRFVRDEAIVNTNIARIDTTNARQDDELDVIDTKLATSIELKDTYLHAENGDYITDEDGNKILGQVYLPVTDSTLSEIGVPADAKVVGDRFNRDEAIINTNVARIDSVNNRQDYEIGILDTKLATSVELKDTYLHAENGDYITDEDGNKILSQLYLPVTDSTLSESGIPADAMAVGLKVGNTFNSQYTNYPISFLHLYDDGSMAQLASKQSGTLKDSVRYGFPQLKISGTLSKVKVQGNSSQFFPKKNYTLTFDREIDVGWGRHKKYVIKANWVDFSHARNVVCAKLWGDVRKTAIKSDDLMTDQAGNYITDQQGNRILTEADPMLSVGLNYGAIDGYPIGLELNNVYWGLYSFNIPKDGWMAKMEFGDREAIVSAEKETAPTRFKALATVDSKGNLTEEDFSMEYCKDEDNQAWIATSLNRMIQSVMDSTGSNYESTCGAYIDIDSAIDYYIFNCLINNTDGLEKNYLLDTYDGAKWYFCPYDMDGVLGNHVNGQFHLSPTAGCTFKKFQDTHRLMHLIYTYDTARLCQRYKELRQNALSEFNVTQVIMNYCLTIPKAHHDYEVLRWPGIFGTDTNNYAQMLNWYRLRCVALDKEITALESAL